MLKNLMDALFGARRPETQEAPREEIHCEKMDSAPEVPKTLPSLDSEVQVLAREVGGLAQGGRLEITLHRLLQICPRSRKKSDAYLGLKRKLKDDYGVDLVITSKACKNQE